jgi:hypothetical protein
MLESAGKRVGGSWYQITAEEAAELIERHAHEFYPTLTSFMVHAGMVQLLAKRAKRMPARPAPRLATNSLFKL